MQVACHLDEFAIDLGDILYIGIGDLNGYGRIFLQAVEHFEAASATIAAHGVSRVGDTL